MFFFSQKTVTKAILFGNVNRRKKTDAFGNPFNRFHFGFLGK